MTTRREHLRNVALALVPAMHRGSNDDRYTAEKELIRVIHALATADDEDMDDDESEKDAAETRAAQSRMADDVEAFEIARLARAGVHI